MTGRGGGHLLLWGAGATGLVLVGIAPWPRAVVVAALLVSLAVALTLRARDLRLRRALDQGLREIAERLETRDSRALSPALAALHGLDQARLHLLERHARLARERDLSHAILESMPESVVVVGADAHVLLANSAFRALVPGESVPVGRPLIESLRSPAFADLVRDAASAGGPMTREIELLHPDPKRFLVTAQPLAGGRVLCVAHDITALRHLEKVRQDFVANVSHELRTPVTALAGYAETLLDGALENRELARKFVEIIHRNAQRLGRLVEDLLALARAEAAPVIACQPIPLGPLLDDVLAQVAPLANPRRIRLRASVPSGCPPPRANADAMQRILLNLLENAVRYSPEGGSVEVSVVSEEGRVELAVKDEGPGIEAVHLPRIFERFYRADAGRPRSTGGAGLGLSIVRHLAEAMGGEVGCTSAPRQGARFFVWLPVATTPEQDANAEITAPRHSE